MKYIFKIYKKLYLFFSSVGVHLIPNLYIFNWCSLFLQSGENFWSFIAVWRTRRVRRMRLSIFGKYAKWN